MICTLNASSGTVILTIYYGLYKLMIQVNTVDEHKKHLEESIVNNLITALERNTITEDEMATISGYVLDRIDTITDELGVAEFLKDISERWPIFKPIVILDGAPMRDKIEDEVAEGVLILAQHGKIENAIKLAQSVTQRTTQ